jgi:predicted nucleic acid-binding protein
MAEPPEWLVVFHARRSDDPRLATLDRGEREALALALESSAELMLIDERDARAVAERCGLKVAGTLRVLRDAAHLNLIDLRAALHRLQQTSFRVSPRLIEAVLRELAC